MNVIAINGSPRAEGNTAKAISFVAEELQKEGIQTEVVHIGKQAVHGCIACGHCAKSGGVCVFDDGLNEVGEKIAKADGLIVGSPVYYAGINGTVKSYLDRLFYSHGSSFRFKPAAGIVCARRAGTTASLQTINQYFEITEMLIVPTVYWSGVHGREAGEMDKDLEGVQIMRQLGKNMAYLVKLMQNACPPEKDKRVMYNFVR